MMLFHLVSVKSACLLLDADIVSFCLGKQFSYGSINDWLLCLRDIKRFYKAV